MPVPGKAEKSLNNGFQDLIYSFIGRFLRPSSGALGTIVAASGVLHEKG